MMTAAARPFSFASHSAWGPRLATAAVWALVGASAVYWALQWGVRPLSSARVPVPAPLQAPGALALAQALGGAPAPAATASVAAPTAQRLVLQGVLAGRESGGGAALIAIDGKPAKPYRVGALVEPGLVLQRLEKRQAWLGATREAASSLTLALPPKK